MTEDTTLIPKPDPKPDSSIGGVSVRAWLALIAVGGVVATHMLVTVAVCVYAVLTRDLALLGTLTTIGEPFYSLAIAATAYYFAKQK